jgi:hypothetical protein
LSPLRWRRMRTRSPPKRPRALLARKHLATLKFCHTVSPGSSAQTKGYLGRPIAGLQHAKVRLSRLHNHPRPLRGRFVVVVSVPQVL